MVAKGVINGKIFTWTMRVGKARINDRIQTPNTTLMDFPTVQKDLAFMG